ncbi:MAG TPA: STAS domain-containing protein [Vicinamibacterales bacterium]|nr:STAS domain-containing protein [Vicinamibacterales bacterium]
MTITEAQVGDVTILRMSGRLELEEGDLDLRDHVDRLVAGGRLKILLDLKAVTRIDSAGIGMLVSKYLSTQKRGGTIKLLHLTRRSDHLMDITRLATVFEIFDDEADAVRSFAATA